MTNSSSQAERGATSGQQTKKNSIASHAYDSDDHDDFNPIKDLMPPSMPADELEKIGKKRGRDSDNLRRLIED